MPKQAPEETSPATTAASHGTGAMNKQGRDAELVSGSDRTAKATGPACADALRDFHLTLHTFRLLYWWPQRE